LGYINLSPDTAGARHESVHSVLDNAGVNTKTYGQILDAMPAGLGRTMRDMFNSSNRAGSADEELPAYMTEYAAHGKSQIAGVTPELRDLYLDTADQVIGKNHGQKAVNTFQRLRTPVQVITNQ
jgi:hypothetical protein